MKHISTSQVLQKENFIFLSQKQRKPTFLQCYFLQKKKSKNLSNLPSSISTITSPIETQTYIIKSPSLKLQNRSFVCQEGLFVLLKSTNIPAISQVQKLQKNQQCKSYFKKDGNFYKPFGRNEKTKQKQIYFDLQRYRYKHQKKLQVNNRLEENRIRQNQRKYLSKYSSPTKYNTESLNVFRP